MIIGFHFRLSSSLQNESFFIIEQQYLQKQFRDTVQTRAYTLSDAVGMIGGYLGLFMGYSLIQFPDFLRSFIINIKEIHLMNK